MKTFKNETQKFYSGEFLFRGVFVLGGFCRGVYVRGVFVLEPGKAGRQNSTLKLNLIGC